MHGMQVNALLGPCTDLWCFLCTVLASATLCLAKCSCTAFPKLPVVSHQVRETAGSTRGAAPCAVAWKLALVNYEGRSQTSSVPQFSFSDDKWFKSSCFIYFASFFSCFRSKSKFSCSYSILVRSRSHPYRFYLAQNRGKSCYLALSDWEGHEMYCGHRGIKRIVLVKKFELKIDSPFCLQI